MAGRLDHLAAELAARFGACETVKSLAEWVRREHGIPCNHMTVWRAIQRYRDAPGKQAAEKLVSGIDTASAALSGCKDDDLVELHRNRLARLSGKIWGKYRRKEHEPEQAAGMLLQISKELRAIMLDRARAHVLLKPAPKLAAGTGAGALASAPEQPEIVFICDGKEVDLSGGERRPS